MVKEVVVVLQHHQMEEVVEVREEVEVTHKQAEEQQHKVIHFGMELLMLREDT